MPTSTGQNWGITSQTYTPIAQADIFSAMRRAEDVSQLPFQPYLGQTVAGFAPSEIAAMQGIYGIQGYAQPYIQGATQLLGQAQAYADPYRYSRQALQQYYNPYQQDVIDATMANIAEENRRQQNDLTSRAIQQGAFGGDRTGIARAELNRIQNLQNAQTLAGLQAQGFSQAQQQYNLAQQRAIEAAQSGAYSLGQLGQLGQQAGMQGLQALLGIGQMERQLGQAQLEDQFKRYMTAQGYPWETAQWLASIVGALGPQAGGTTTGTQIGGSSQTTQGASPLSAIAGLATTGLGGLLKLFPGAGGGAKDGGRINKADGGGFGDLMSLGMEDPWYGFDPQRIDEERKRQWLSRQDVDQTAKQQIKDRSWLTPDETYDPYEHDDVGYEADGGPVLRNYGGRTGYKDGGGPYEGTVPYVSGDTVGFIDNLKLPSPPSPHIPKADFLKPPSVGEGGGDTFGDIAKSLPQIGATVSKLLSKKDGSEGAAAVESEEAQSEEQYGGRVTMADGGGFSDWLAGLKGTGGGYPTTQAPYVSPTPQPRQEAAQPFISNLGDVYKYALGREADPEGLKYWQQRQQEGTSLGDIANYLLGSEEGQQKYGSADLGSIKNIFSQLTSVPSTSAPSKAYSTLLTTGGAPILNPDGTPVTMADVQTPSAVQGEPGKGAYSEGDIAAAGQISGPDAGLVMAAAQNPMMGILIQQQQQQKQEAANRKVAEMRAHNASVYNAPRSPIGYFMNLDYSAMSPSGLFGFNPISPYYSPIVPTAISRNTGGKVKGFDLGGMPSVGSGQLPNIMTGHGSQTNPSSFQPGYNPSAFTQQRADGGRTGYADGGSADVIDKIARGIAAIESGGSRNPYSVVGARSRKGDRPYGKYQIMGANIPSWGREAGYPNLTVREFLANPKIQEDVARHQFAKIYAKSGNPSAVAGEWLGGPGWRRNKSADVLGTTVPEYMRRFARAYGQAPRTAVAAAEPVKVLATRPLTGERVGEKRESALKYINPKDPSGPLLNAPAAPAKKGFSLSDLNPIGTAHAEEGQQSLPEGVIPRPRVGFESLQGPGQLAGVQSSKQLSPSSLLPPTGGPKTGISGLDMRGFNPPGMAGDRDLMGAKPQGFGTFAPTDMGLEASKPTGEWELPWDKPSVSEDEPTEKAAPEIKPAKRAKEPAAPDTGKYYGDWRDYEPWKSDPIGGFLDELMGDVPKSATKGKPADVSSGPDIDLGGLADLFKGFSHGGRAHYDAGGPADIEDLDPELFSPEPMTESKGFESLADEELARKEVVSEDDTIPVREAPRREAAAPSGLGNLSSLGDALIAAGFGMMAGRSPNAWQNIGMGGLKGVEAYQSAEAIRARREGELAKIRQKEREAQASRDYLKEFLGAPPAEAAPVRPGKVEAADTTTAFDKLGALYDELERYQRAIAMAPDAATASRLRLMQENLKTRISRLERGEAQSIRLSEEARRAHKESPEGIIETKTAEDIAKQEIEMGQLGRKSQDTLANLNTMKELITDPSVHTGPLEESKLRPIRQVISQYTGIGKEGVAKTGDLVARANTMVRDALGGSLGAGVSNADVKFLQSAQVSLGNTPEENKRIVDAAIRITKLNMTLSKEAENYKESHGGHLDAGWIPYRDKVQEQFYGGSQGGGGSTGTTKSGINWSVK